MVVDRIVVAALVCLTLTFGSSAYAEDAEQPIESSATRIGEAQRLFQAGTSALKEERFVEARALLQRSLDLHAHPATVFNLAEAHSHSSQTLKAALLLEELVAGKFGAIDSARDAEVRTVLAGLYQQLSRLTVTARGAPEMQLYVDSQHVTALGAGQSRALLLEPGPHVISLRAPDRVSVEQRIELAKGQKQSFAITLQSEPRKAAPVDESSWTSNPWIWIGVGVVAVGITASVLLSRPAEEPVSDPAFGNTYAFRFDAL